MNERPDSGDELLDRNLRAFASALSLPKEPSPEQQSTWTGLGEARGTVLQRGVLFMKNHRALTFAGAGSVLAAGVVMAVMLLVPSSAGTVGAAEIFRSFHDTMTDGFRVTYTDLSHPLAPGIRTEGESVVVFDEVDDEPERALATHFAFRIRTDSHAAALSGLEYAIEGAVVDGRMWAYCRMDGLPDGAIAGNPQLQPIVEMYQVGVLINMTDLMDGLAARDWQASPPADSPLRDPKLTAAMEEAFEQARTMSDRVGQMTPNAEANNLLAGLLRGVGDLADFERLAELIEERAGRVTVARQSDGAYLLRADQFDFSDTPFGSLLAGFFDEMTLEMLYDARQGLRSVSAEHVGGADGTVYLEPVQLSMDDPRFSDERYRTDGVTRVLEGPAIEALLQQAIPLPRKGQ